ncbi:MAG TPA: C45 family peptidase [Streptosporangiaceae bacterium]|nr:C45 family peptidase [Streptosporangiaceae bacterium]
MTVPFVRASGTPFEVGYQHGAALAAGLRAFLADDLARIGKLAPASAPVTLAQLEPLLGEYSAAIAAAAPSLGEEIAGLAEGAGISPAEAVLLQARRELIGYQKVPVPACGDCTTYASLSAGPGGGPVLAQTVDLNGNLDDQLAVLDVGLSGSPRRSLVLSFGGLLGYLGLNSDGLAIGLNLVLGGDWLPGVPPYLAIRYLLDSAGNVKDALAILAGLPLASSRSLTLCDPATVACVEVLGGELRVVGSGPATVHTNHFLDQDFSAADELNVFARNSSVRRLRAGAGGLAGFAAQPARRDVNSHFALLSVPPICVADTGDLRRERTVAAVVMLPDRGELHVRPGNPALSSTQAFRVERS